MQRQWPSIIRETDATTSVEYAVGLMLVILAAITALQFFGKALNDNLHDSNRKMGQSMGITTVTEVGENE